MCGICFVCSLPAHQCAFSIEKQENGHGCQQKNHVHTPSDWGTNHCSDATCSKRGNTDLHESFLIDSLLHHRGPDVSKQHVIHIAENVPALMQGCVLHLRGHMTPQPVLDIAGNALMWNGEIFGGIKVEVGENDTQVLFDMLVRKTSEEEILKTLQKIQGPWSFIYWQAAAKTLWFGRDMFGRRSLLWHLPSIEDNNFILSSVALGNTSYTEVPSVGIFCLHFSALTTENMGPPALTLYPWINCRWPGTTQTVIDTEPGDMFKYLYPCQSPVLPLTVSPQSCLDSWIPEINSYVPDMTTPASCAEPKLTTGSDMSDWMTQLLESRQDLKSLAENLIQVLQEAVEKRVYNLPRHSRGHKESLTDHKVKENSANEEGETEPSYESAGITNSTAQLSISRDEKMSLSSKVAVLFSGGLDSTVLAALADRCVPPDETIDLLNVAFEQPVQHSHSSQKSKPKHKKTQGKEKTDTEKTTPQREVPLVCPHCGKKQNEQGQVKERNTGISNSVSTVEWTNIHDALSAHSAAVGHSHESPNGSVQETRTAPRGVEVSTAQWDCKHCNAKTVPGETGNPQPQVPDPYDVPDRQTGRLALSELNPQRKWNFVEINVSQAELQALRESRIRRLIYPLYTVLDDSIGCAVWFAARGQGMLASDEHQPCVSTARVILCGMAADEQFAGYSRHRVTFKTKGWAGLQAEIQEEMWRISARNLGRDDRIITDHGKESRFPFLDETFTRFVSDIPLHQRADLRLPRGIGEKLLLRLAALKLGLKLTALQPKRAIQFGSKIAKLDKRKEKGSDVCDRLT